MQQNLPMNALKCLRQAHNNLPIIKVCLSIECKEPRYNCLLCMMDTHKDHNDQCFELIDLHDKIKNKNDIRDQMEMSILNVFDDMKKIIAQLLEQLDNTIKMCLQLDQLAFKKLLNLQNLNYDDIYHLQDLLKDEFNPYKKDLLISTLLRSQDQFTQQIKEVIDSLNQEHLVQKLPEFIFRSDLAYKDIKISNPKTIEDKLVLSISSKLGQALVYPSLQDCTLDIIKIKFRIVSLGMSVHIGLGVDLKHTLFCSINQAGEVYSKFDHQMNGRRYQFSFTQSDIILCIFDRSTNTLHLSNLRTNESFQFNNIVSKEPLYFFLQILFSKVMIED
ncbi:hypothetical protein pb186bvf_011433 [Paramecium bursaria]